MCAKPAKRVPKKKNNLHQMPEHIPAGEILSDIKKNQWILGKSIGVGGFGEVYSAAPYTGKIPKDYPNVIKIEPHANGPLFVEMHFYMKNAKPEDIEAWKKKKKLLVLGMPQYRGSGSHEYKNIKYRFLVMDRYGTDLWKIFEENNKHFPEHTVYQLALQIINVLEYIHDKTYVHADIKGANILLNAKSQDHVYLVDFGLATRYTTKTEYKLEPKNAHNGTIEYTSRDAHMGILTMRGDFEILGYNMIHWLCGALPWEKDLKNPTNVQSQKEKAFQDIPKFLNECFHNSTPEPVLKYMNYLNTVKFNEKPNYEKLKEILTNGLKELGHTLSGKLNFKNSPTAKKQVVSKSKDSPNIQKVRKVQEMKISSPQRKRKQQSASPARHNSLNDSNVGIIIDKKRGKLKDIKNALEDIESDEEYDIKIVKKTKVKATANTSEAVESVKTKVPSRTRKKVSNNRTKHSSSDSEPEQIISRGTKSRSAKAPNLRSNKKTQQLTIDRSTTDEDIFS